jgi:hypothetical protein
VDDQRQSELFAFVDLDELVSWNGGGTVADRLAAVAEAAGMPIVDALVRIAPGNRAAAKELRQTPDGSRWRIRSEEGASFADVDTMLTLGGLQGQYRRFAFVGTDPDFATIARQIRRDDPQAEILVLSPEPERLRLEFAAVSGVRLAQFNGSAPPAGTTRVFLDLDNILLWEWTGSGDGPATRLPELLDRVRRELRVPRLCGFATMNEGIAARFDPVVRQVVMPRGFEIRVVPELKQEADRDLYTMIGRTLREGCDRFVIVTVDRDFAGAMTEIRKRAPETSLVLFAESLSPHGRAKYQDIGARIFELAPKRPERAMARALAENEQHVLICDLCGRRSLLASTSAGLCWRCGGAMRSVWVDPDRPRIVPLGKVPFRDGPVVEVHSPTLLLRIVVLCTPSTTFGRTSESSEALGQAALGDLVDPQFRDHISREQFTVTRRGEGRYVLNYLKGVPMFLDGDPPVPVAPGGAGVELAHGQVFWLNPPREAPWRLKFMFKTSLAPVRVTN